MTVSFTRSCKKYSLLLLLAALAFVMLTLPARAEGIHVRDAVLAAADEALRQAFVDAGQLLAATIMGEDAAVIRNLVDIRHVHERHVARNGVKAYLAQREQLIALRGIHNPVVDVIRVFECAQLRSLDENLAEITCNNVCAQRCQASRKIAVATGNVQYLLFSLQFQQTFLCRANDQALELISFAHIVIPECSILVPDIMHLARECLPVFVAHHEPPYGQPEMG